MQEVAGTEWNFLVETEKERERRKKKVKEGNHERRPWNSSLL